MSLTALPGSMTADIGILPGGVDFIWEAADADVKTTPYTLEVSTCFHIMQL